MWSLFPLKPSLAGAGGCKGGLVPAASVLSR